MWISRYRKIVDILVGFPFVAVFGGAVDEAGTFGAGIGVHGVFVGNVVLVIGFWVFVHEDSPFGK